MEFCERLYQLRKRDGLSQEELAHIMDVSRQAVQKWESGASKPDVDNLVSLADYFGVSLDTLIRGREEAPVPPQTAPVPCLYRWGYEYKSRRTLFGLPLVHINVGHGIRWARGIIAVGDIATGLAALGGFSAGLVSAGGISAGLLALGGIALGGAALGGLAVGVAAFGALSVGILSVGVCAIGRYAAGVSAVGSAMAVGVAAASPVAAVGIDTSDTAALALSLEELWNQGTTLSQAAERIAPYLPGTPGWVIRLLLRFAHLI